VAFCFCDDLGEAGFGWVVEEPVARTSHALVADGRVWLVDPLDWPEAVERALALGEPAGVVQLLDRHDRDCGLLSERLGVPRVVVPTELPDSPFGCIPVVQRGWWRECALWWPEQRTLVVADALGTNRFYTSGRAPLGVHVLLRLAPPHVLAGLEPQHVLVGHGDGVHGREAAAIVSRALAESRRWLPGVLLRLPLAWRS
jgi:hypothetical protein